MNDKINDKTKLKSGDTVILEMIVTQISDGLGPYESVSFVKFNSESPKTIRLYRSTINGCEIIPATQGPPKAGEIWHFIETESDRNHQKKILWSDEKSVVFEYVIHKTGNGRHLSGLREFMKYNKKTEI